MATKTIQKENPFPVGDDVSVVDMFWKSLERVCAACASLLLGKLDGGTGNESEDLFMVCESKGVELEEKR